MIRRVQGSLKYRLFYGYCSWLERRKCRNLPEIVWAVKMDPALPRLLIVTCERDIPLLAHSLESLQQIAARVPQLCLVGDSEACTQQLRSRFKGDKTALEICHWRRFEKNLTTQEIEFVNAWEQSKPWGGYARKFAATIGANRQTSLLLSDADILWKRDLFPTLERLIKGRESILAGKDHAYSYDREVLSALECPEALARPPINCGFVYYAEGVLEKVLTADVFKAARRFVDNATTHLEQTLIAYAFHRAGGKYFDAAEVATTLDDNFRLREHVPCAIRHYAGAKHLFWRDV